MSEKEINDVLKEGIIRYSQVWEDYELLVKGLKIDGDDNILSIASAGCNAMALLLEEPSSVTAVDLNPSQCAIVHLKKAAILQLEHAEFAILMGARGTPEDRWPLYTRIKDSIPEDAQIFWDHHREIIEHGILHCGRLEKYFRVFQEGFIAKAATAEQLRAYLNLSDAEEQSSFFEKIFGNEKFAEAFKQYTSRNMITTHGRDESQFRFVEVEDVGQHFYDRFRYTCTQVPTSGNFYQEYLLTSEYSDLEVGPPYLRPSNFQKLRELMPRLEILTKGLDECLFDHEEGFYSKANLSDLFEYLSPEVTEDFLRKLATRMRPGGRLAYWNLLVNRQRPESLSDWLKPHEEEAQALWKQDRAFFYGAFHLEEITRPG